MDDGRDSRNICLRYIMTTSATCQIMPFNFLSKRLDNVDPARDADNLQNRGGASKNGLVSSEDVRQNHMEM